MYSIKDLEKISGVKAHTLRIWERRYQLLSPQRTDTNIRLYDDEQLVRLLNVKSLLEFKWKISKIGQLSKEQLHTAVEDVLLDSYECNFEPLVHELIRHTLAYDEEQFVKQLSNAFDKVGVEKTMTEIVYPFLTKIGLMWRIDKLIPAQEHFASNIIRQKLNAAIDELPISHTKNKRFLLFLPEGEYHEIGLLLCQYLLREQGYPTYYFGSNVPLENVIEGSNDIKIDYLFCFMVTLRPAQEIQNYLDTLMAKFKGEQLMIAGRMILEGGEVNLPERAVHVASLDHLKQLLV